MNTDGKRCRKNDRILEILPGGGHRGGFGLPGLTVLTEWPVWVLRGILVMPIATLLL